MLSNHRRETEAGAPTPKELLSQEGDFFRRHFESLFEPLKIEARDSLECPGSDDQYDTSSDAASCTDWEGFSDEESGPQVEVVEFGTRQATGSLTDTIKHSKAFRSASLPVSDNLHFAGQKQQQSNGTTKATAVEVENLRHDLELQQLLQESQLLDKRSDISLMHIHRHKAIDLRMQSLGAKSSLFKQGKMPVSHRRGIQAKAKLREANRRKEAKENGIILEKESKASHAKVAKRERGIGGLSIGKFRNGTLMLSSRDKNEIQGPQIHDKVASRRRR